MNRNEIVIFETEDSQIKLPVTVENDTVWLNRNQMSELFDRDVKTKGGKADHRPCEAGYGKFEQFHKILAVALVGLSLALNIPDKIPIEITLPSKNRHKKSTYRFDRCLTLFVCLFP